jgi:hypothetical protein
VANYAILPYLGCFLESAVVGEIAIHPEVKSHMVTLYFGVVRYFGTTTSDFKIRISNKKKK